jgi:hypothetical protein
MLLEVKVYSSWKAVQAFVFDILGVLMARILAGFVATGLAGYSSLFSFFIVG